MPIVRLSHLLLGGDSKTGPNNTLGELFGRAELLDWMSTNGRSRGEGELLKKWGIRSSRVVNMSMQQGRMPTDGWECCLDH